MSIEQRQLHIAKLKRRALVMDARFRAAELAKINELECRFAAHMSATAEDINAHTTASLEPLIARAEGRPPPRREGQSAASRKAELDQVLVGLRHERKELVLEERAERDAMRAAAPPRKRARASGGAARSVRKTTVRNAELYR